MTLKRIFINWSYGGFLNDESEILGKVKFEDAGIDAIFGWFISVVCTFCCPSQEYFDFVSALDPLVHGVSHDKLHSALGKGAAAVTSGGLGVITAGVFLAGEMAGSGVLALPNAMVGTGENMGICNTCPMLHCLT